MGVRRSHGVGGALLVVAASSGVPGPAWAQQSDYTWCVQTGVGGGARCGAPEYECDNAAPFASLTEALAAAEAAEGPLPGQRPEHLICVDGVVSEDLPTFDLAMLGPRVEVEFDPAAPSNLCPGTGPAAGPLMLVDGFTDLTAGPPTLVPEPVNNFETRGAEK